MKKIILFITLILSLVLLTACASTANDSTSTTKKDSSSVSKLFSGSIDDLMAKGVPVHCTYNGEFEGVNSNQDIYVDGAKFAVKIVMLVNDRTQTSNIILNDNWFYSWTSTSDKGMKMSLEFMKGKEDLGFDTDVVLDYNCKPWISKKSTFTPPTDIEFKDFGDLIGGLGNLG